jgi:hypothetical protein
MKEYNEVEYSSDEEDIKKKKKPKIPRAPRKITPLPNPDKKLHEKYRKSHNPIRFPKPFKCCISGRPNSGKSLMALHIIMAHQEKKPKFDEIHIIHGCKDTHTSEWDRIEPTSTRQDIPSYEEYDPKNRTLLVFDDTDYTMLRNDELMRLSELVRFGSSHCNVSLIFLTQVFFRIPKVIKDCCNVFIIYKPVDLDELATLGRRVGLKKEEISHIFNSFLPHWRDSLLINLIPDAPYKFGKNLFQKIQMDDGSDSESN